MDTTTTTAKRPPYYTVETLAKELGMKKSAVRWRIENGDFPARKLGRRTIILGSDLEACLSALPAWTPEPDRTGGAGKGKGAARPIPAEAPKEGQDSLPEPGQEAPEAQECPQEAPQAAPEATQKPLSPAQEAELLAKKAGIR
jgi:hypothetical protein